MSVTVNQIVISDKFKDSDDGFKYFIDYEEDENVNLPLMSGYIKYFENGGKNMSFMIKDGNILDKYNENWDKIKEKLNIKFHSIPVYDQKYIKVKVRQFDAVIKNLLGNEIPKEIMHYTCVACITIDSVMKTEKKNYSQVYLEECTYKAKKIKMSKFINAKLQLDSEPDSEADSE